MRRSLLLSALLLALPALAHAQDGSARSDRRRALQSR